MEGSFSKGLMKCFADRETNTSNDSCSNSGERRTKHMAQRRSLTWTELRVGILVITSFALLALAIFYVSGQSGFFVKKYTLKAYFQNANNLRSGAEVSLEGVTIGNVATVAVSKFADPMKAVEAVMKLDQRYKN